MKKEKEFDCVRMKDEIQAKLLKEYEGLSDDEIHEAAGGGGTRSRENPRARR